MKTIIIATLLLCASQADAIYFDEIVGTGSHWQGTYTIRQSADTSSHRSLTRPRPFYTPSDHTRNASNNFDRGPLNAEPGGIDRVEAAVAEPSSLWLILTGIALIAVARTASI